MSTRKERQVQVALAIAIGTLALCACFGLALVPDAASRRPAQAAAPTTTSSMTTATAPPPSTSAPAATGAPSTTANLQRSLRLTPRPIDRRELVVFLQPVATKADVDAVRRSLEAMRDVASIRFVDKAEAYAEMKVLFAEHPELIEAIDVGDAPVNFHVLPRTGVDRHVIGTRLRGHRNVLSIVYPGE